MHRTRLLQLLREYTPIDERDAACRQRFLTFVETHADCFERSLAIGHVTASAWILDAAGERVLLTHHRKLDLWLQPGGHADGDPDVAAVAMREAREETGLEHLELVSDMPLDIDIHPIPAWGSVGAHEHFDVRFALRTGGSTDYIVSEESHDLAWVPLSDIERYTTEESILRMRAKWLVRS